MNSLASDRAFAGSIPQLYERYLVPLIFEPYASDLAHRALQRGPARVLEIAAGTGVVTRHLARVLGQLGRVLEHGDGVQIDHAIKALVLRLERHKFGDGAEIVAEMQVARRLHAREDAGLGLGFLHASALT